MSPLLFSAPPVSALPVRGRPERVAIRRIFCVVRHDKAHAKEMGVAVDREAPQKRPWDLGKDVEQSAVLADGRCDPHGDTRRGRTGEARRQDHRGNRPASALLRSRSAQRSNTDLYTFR